MKKRYRVTIILIMFLIFQNCNKDELNVINPNSPTFDALNTESGVTQLASGVYNASAFGVAWGYHWVVNAFHEAMGDAIYVPWGNFGFRWVNQPTSITLDDGTVVTPPQEGSQGDALEVRNVRTQTTENAFAWEWEATYRMNNTANIILDIVDQIEFSGDAETKRKVFRTWAYYWKGYAYSRIGSMYTAGLIINEPNTTNSNFVSNIAIIEEAKRNLDLAIETLNSITADITAITSSIIPDGLVPSSFRGSTPGNMLTKEAWIRNINTLIARNILVNKKVSDMTSADWTNIINYTNEGIDESDFVFVMKQDGNNFEISTTVNHRLQIGWHFPSERLVQDFKVGDARFEDNFIIRPDLRVNQSGRGIQYGTRYGLISNVDYGITENNKANIYYAGTYSENQLMRAEALIYTGQIDAGLSLIDEVRQYQQSGLVSVSGTGMSQEEALEELRVERRIGLFLRGVSFYDARRWDITKTPRSGLTVLDAEGNINTNATFNYNYLDYWSVPDQETVFNEPSDGSVPVITQE